MTKDAALKLALEALDIVKLLYTQNRHVNEAITAIKEALAQPEQEPIDFAYVMEAGDDRWKKLPIQERNFCQRCGKRTADLTTIHTCTPPQTIAEEHFAKFDSDINLAINKAMVEEDDDTQVYKKPWVGLTSEELLKCADGFHGKLPCGWADIYYAIEAKLKEKNA